MWEVLWLVKAGQRSNNVDLFCLIWQGSWYQENPCQHNVLIAVRIQLLVNAAAQKCNKHSNLHILLCEIGDFFFSFSLSLAWLIYWSNVFFCGTVLHIECQWIIIYKGMSWGFTETTVLYQYDKEHNELHFCYDPMQISCLLPTMSSPEESTFGSVF